VQPNSVGVIDPSTNKLVAQVRVGVEPEAIAVGKGGVWVANTGESTISRVDPTNTAIGDTRIPVDDYPSDIVVETGAVWVAYGAPGEVARINTELNRAASPISALGGTGCGPPQASVTTGIGYVWLACRSDLGKVDARTGAGTRIGLTCGLLESPSAVSPKFSDIAFGLDALWIANQNANSVTQLDPTTCVKLGNPSTGKAPTAIAIGRKSVWVTNFDDDTVTRIDVPGPGEAISESAPIGVGDGPVDVAFGEGALWVANSLGRSVTKIDPVTGNVLATIKLGNEPQRVAAGDGKVWVTVRAPETAETGS
jgi:serine/threonine-protein kinase